MAMANGKWQMAGGDFGDGEMGAGETANSE